jgi:8-oxo-dGTP pyrophosphatase MutT (NUDIX family)
MSVAPFSWVPLGLRRRGYRVAYAFLCAYWFVRRPESQGVKCVLTDGDRVLLVRHTYGRRTWDLPGGAIKSGEQPRAAAQREMHEELGVRIDDWTAIGEVAGRQQHRHDTLHCFQAELDNRPVKLDLGELEVARWFAWDELPVDRGDYVDPVLARFRAQPSA